MNTNFENSLGDINNCLTGQLQTIETIIFGAE